MLTEAVGAKPNAVVIDDGAAVKRLRYLSSFIPRIYTLYVDSKWWEMEEGEETQSKQKSTAGNEIQLSCTIGKQGWHEHFLIRHSNTENSAMQWHTPQNREFSNRVQREVPIYVNLKQLQIRAVIFIEYLEIDSHSSRS